MESVQNTTIFFHDNGSLLRICQVDSDIFPERFHKSAIHAPWFLIMSDLCDEKQQFCIKD